MRTGAAKSCFNNKSRKDLAFLRNLKLRRSESHDLVIGRIIAWRSGKGARLSARDILQNRALAGRRPSPCTDLEELR
jgi:hypothetical protein